MAAKFMHGLLVWFVLVTSIAPTHFVVRAQPERPLLVVVVAASTGITDISSATLRRTFLGVPDEYRSGKRFLPLNHPTGTWERTHFDRVVLGLAPDEVGRYWIDQRIRGAAMPPRTVPSAELVVSVVASYPGAITYTDPSLINSALRVLTVDGKSASDAGYFLAR